MLCKDLVRRLAKVADVARYCPPSRFLCPPSTPIFFAIYYSIMFKEEMYRGCLNLRAEFAHNNNEDKGGLDFICVIWAIAVEWGNGRYWDSE